MTDWIAEHIFWVLVVYLALCAVLIPIRKSHD